MDSLIEQHVCIPVPYTTVRMWPMNWNTCRKRRKRWRRRISGGGGIVLVLVHVRTTSTGEHMPIQYMYSVCVCLSVCLSVSLEWLYHMTTYFSEMHHMYCKGLSTLELDWNRYANQIDRSASNSQSMHINRIDRVHTTKTRNQFHTYLFLFKARIKHHVHISVCMHNVQLHAWLHMCNMHCMINFKLIWNYLWKWIGIYSDSNRFY